MHLAAAGYYDEARKKTELDQLLEHFGGRPEPSPLVAPMQALLAAVPSLSEPVTLLRAALADPEAREAEIALRKRIDARNVEAGTLNLGQLPRAAVGGPSGAGGGGAPADPRRGYATRARPDDGLEQSRAYAMRQRH